MRALAWFGVEGFPDLENRPSIWRVHKPLPPLEEGENRWPLGPPERWQGRSDGMVRSKARGQPRLQTGRAQWCAASSKPLGPNSSLRTSQVQCSSSDVSRDHGHRSSLTVWSQVSQASRAEVYMGSIEAHSSTNSAPTHASVSLNDIFLFDHCLPSLHLNANSF